MNWLPAALLFCIAANCGAHVKPCDSSKLEPSAHHEPLVMESAAEVVQSGAQAPGSKRTLYACEEKELQIECQLGESIHLIRANYGRFSIQLCNENGQLDWKVNCMSPPSSMQIIANSCQSKQSCHLLASNSIFGDPCPGTQKYLEVHYQCVAASPPDLAGPASNRTDRYLAAAPSRLSKPANSVIATADSGQSNSERARWAPGPQSPPPQQQVSLPTWMMEVPLAPSSAPASRALCPETVWRQVRWPASPPGLLVRAACPPHAQPLAPGEEPLPVALACQPDASWAPRAHSARCVSNWLRQLNQRAELGDSPLSLLSELVLRTRPLATPPTPAPGALFGQDLLVVGRLVHRLAGDEMADLLNRINDDKQRLAFVREVVQALVELVSNLVHEQHSDAWLDLAGEVQRARLAGELARALESSAVLLAGALAAQALPSPPEVDQFVKSTESVHLSVRSLSGQANRSLELQLPSESSLLASKWMNLADRYTLHLQTSPADALADGANPDPAQQHAGELGGHSAKTLKVVTLIVKGLGRHMDGQREPSATRWLLNSNLVTISIVADPRFKVAPIKVDLSAPIELVFEHLSPAGSGLSGQLEWPAGRAASKPRCVYWDTTASDWLSDGCKLVSSNSTHSSCACNQLASFGLLSQWDQSAIGATSATPASSAGATTNQAGFGEPAGQQEQAHRRKVQLDSVENELILPYKPLYLAQMLNGHLFGANQADELHHYLQASNQPEQQMSAMHSLLYGSCLVAAGLLVLQLAALAYQRAHTRRLLASIPAQPPPSLLVANGRPTDEPAKASRARAPGRLAIPAHLLVHLLAMQLLVVLLVESQNYFGRRASLRRPAGELAEPAGPAGEPIGTPTWAAVLALYYLVAAVTCWLAVQLARLNASLSPGWLRAGCLGLLAAPDRPPQHSPASASSLSRAVLAGDGSSGAPSLDGTDKQYGSTTNSTSATAAGNAISSGSIYAANRQPSGRALAGLQSSISPSSSFGSSAAPGAYRRLGGRGLRALGARLVRLALLHLLPPGLLVGSIGWLSAPRAAKLNNSAYSSQAGAMSQLAYWPLLVDATWPYLSALIYYGPSLCLMLIGFAIFSLLNLHGRAPKTGADQAKSADHKPRPLVNPYGSSSLVGAHNQPPASRQPGQEQQMALNKQSDNQAPLWLLSEPGSAPSTASSKFVCLALSSLVALHSICWISFFAHIQRSLNMVLVKGGPSQWSQPQAGLLYAFAASNLALVLLVSLMQRHTLRRVAQLCGLWRVCACTRHSRDRFYTGSAAQVSGSKLKVSPSSQSLFVISQAVQQQQQQQQQAQFYHYGPTYGQQQGYHLYQQLTGNNIYDSASALNQDQPAQMHQMHQLDMAQAPVHSFTLNRAPSQQALVRALPMTMKAQQSMIIMRQQQHQHSGEADGPLVALESAQSSNSSQLATIGPVSHLSSLVATNQQLGYPPSQLSTAHQLFRQQQQARIDDTSAILGAATRRHCSTSGADANQHPSQAAYAINSSRSYTDALKAAMMQQHQLARPSSPSALHCMSSSAHFRRSNSKLASHQLRDHQAPSMMDRPSSRADLSGAFDSSANREQNIYDVANYCH